MKKIVFYRNKLSIEVPDYYEYTVNEYYPLVLFQQKNKAYTIKFLVIDSNIDDKHKEMYNEIKSKGYMKIYSEDKFYNVYNHKIEIENHILFVTSFEIIYKNYYVNIRVNMLEEQDKKTNEYLIEYIDKIINTLRDN